MAHRTSPPDWEDTYSLHCSPAHQHDSQQSNETRKMKQEKCHDYQSSRDFNCHAGSAPGTMGNLVIDIFHQGSSMTLLLMPARHRSGDTKIMESAITLSWHYHHAMHQEAPHPTYHHDLRMQQDPSRRPTLTCYRHCLQHGSNNCGIICEQQEVMTRRLAEPATMHPDTQDQDCKFQAISGLCPPHSNERSCRKPIP